MQTCNMYVQRVSLCFWTEITVCVYGIHTLGTITPSAGLPEDIQRVVQKSGLAQCFGGTAN